MRGFGNPFTQLAWGPVGSVSAADYLEITKNFGTIFVTDVHKMGLSQKDMVSVLRNVEYRG